MYLIQQVTKKPTAEIIGFFYDFGKQIFITGCENMTGRSIRKDIQILYPGTAIPVKILVKGEKTYNIWNEKTKRYTSGDSFSGTMEVTFPDNATYMDTEKIVDMIVEQELLGGCSLPDFEAPKSRTPKMYKDLIDQVLKGKDDEIICNSGHSRTTGSSDETLDGSDD